MCEHRMWYSDAQRPISAIYCCLFVYYADFIFTKVEILNDTVNSARNKTGNREKCLNKVIWGILCRFYAFAFDDVGWLWSESISTEKKFTNNWCGGCLLILLSITTNVVLGSLTL